MKVKYTPLIIHEYDNISIDVIYDVYQYKKGDSKKTEEFYIMDNKGKKCWFTNFGLGSCYDFTDVTTEYRNDTIDEILK